MIVTKRCPPAEGLIATGTYFLRQGQRKLGEEAIQYFELPRNQGYQLRSHLVLQAPLPHTQRLTLEMEADWRYRAARVELEATERCTLARYERNESQLSVQVESAGRNAIETALPWDGSALDYPSALFAAMICKRTNIPPGDSSNRNVLRIQVPSLEPQRLHTKCARLFDSFLPLEIGTFIAREYVLHVSSAEILHIWVDEAGMPLRVERAERGEIIRFELTRYRLFRA